MSVHKKIYKKITTHSLLEMKQNKEKISMLTAYDYTLAKIVDSGGVDVILVGDSASNVMAGNEEPNEMFGKIMSISDTLMWRWFELLSFLPEDEIKELQASVEAGMNPRDAKFKLAIEIVDRFHEKGEGEKCKEAFLKRFQKGAIPEDIEEARYSLDNESIPLVNLLKETGMVASTSEASRLIKQGGIKIDSKKVEDPKMLILAGTKQIYQVGKRKFLKIET